MPSRRDVLETLGSGAALGTAGVLATGVATAATELDEATPDFVSRSYDSDLLKAWRPWLVVDHLDIQPYATYAYVARSNERETAALSYWHTYRGQNGWLGADSHFGDHEPVVLFVDEETDELVEVAYSAYHWLAGRTTTPPTADEGRPTFRAAKPWHHHLVTDETGSHVDLEHLDDERLEDWIANGWPVHVPAVARPWVMRTRGSWWEDGLGGLSDERILRWAALTAGLAGADSADTENLDT